MFKLANSSLIVALFILSEFCAAQVFDEQFDHWPVELKIDGRILVTDGPELDELAGDMLRLAPVQKLSVLVRDSVKFKKFNQILSPWMSADSEAVLNIREFETLTETLVDDLNFESDGLALISGIPLSADELVAMQKFKPGIQKLLRGDGLLVVDNDFATYLGAFYRDGDGKIRQGLNLFPDTWIQTRYSNNDADRKQLMKATEKNERIVGLGISENCLLSLSGRKVMCLGPGDATFVLPACNKYLPQRIQTISQPKRGQFAQKYLIDLTEWRRDAIDRTLPQFPADNPQEPCVKNGTLIMVGGGGMPAGLMDKMIELAGGVENAKMVYIPCSSREEVGDRQGTVEMWKRMGVKHATFIHTKDRKKANSDETFFAALKDATGIWFGGGRQWNFADSYYGTRTHQLMKAVLDRGGVIGGSSAGASIQGRYLARATPIGNLRIMAPGYERGGLGFLSGVAIDQHFSQRGRQKDMSQLVNRYPQLLGIGLDEATALIVQQSKAEVVGKGRVYFYDRTKPVVEGQDDFTALGAGSVYELSERKVVKGDSDSD